MREFFRLRLERRLRSLARSLLLVTALSSPIWFYWLFLTDPEDFPYGSSLLYVPLLVALCAVLFSLQSKHDLNLRLLLAAGLGCRCAASALAMWTGFVVYEGGIDAFHYWNDGMIIMSDFRSVGWAAFQPPYVSTHLMSNFVGLLMIVVGNAVPTLFILFALFGLWGSYFFYRAFTIAFPNGNRMAYGYLIFLLPSIMYWASPVSKDAVAQFFIGLAVLGFARLRQKINLRSITIYFAGIFGIYSVRPHVAAMLALAGLMPYALGRSRGGAVGTALKILLVPVLIVGTVMIARDAATFTGDTKGTTQGAIDTINTLSHNSDYGGSSFGGASLPVRIAEAPFLLFRPFPFEVHNVSAAISALEGMALLYIAWRRRRQLWEIVIRHWRQPYVAFILCYTAIFSVVFAAAISNFGILVRQRIMMMPLTLMLFCIDFSEAKAGVPSVGEKVRLRNRMRWLAAGHAAVSRAANRAAVGQR